MVAEKICPSCKHKNVDSASVCSSCGTLLEGKPTDPMAATEYFDEHPGVSGETALTFINVKLIPDGGIGVYVPGAGKSFYVPVRRELFLGREMDAPLNTALDLSDLDAFNQGVSRQHAKLRRADFGFEIIDLASRNGTWLNGMQLVPKKPYPLANGSQVRLGRMQLFIVYHVAHK